MVDIYFPLGAIDFKLVGLPSRLTDELGMYEGPNGPLFNVNVTADAGLIYGQGTTVVKKESTFYADLDMCDYIYYMVGQSDNIPKLLEALDWVRMAKLKNKAEVYSIDDMYKKTRNIQVMPSGPIMLSMMMLNQAYHAPPTVLNHETSRSIIGWSPFKGGMNQLIRKVLGEGLGYFIVYADNLWITGLDEYGEEVWISGDGVKNESSVTAGDARNVALRALDEYEKVDDHWVRIAEHFYPFFCASGIAVWGGLQLYVPFLSSGVPGTAYQNQTPSIEFGLELTSPFQGKPRIPKVRAPKEGEKKRQFLGWEHIMSKLARHYEVEYTVPIADFQLSMKELTADILGFSVVYLKDIGLDEYVGVLQYERLLKGLAFNKSKYLTSEDQFVSRAINLFRYRAFFLLGGWFYPGINTLLLNLCAANYIELRDMSVSVDPDGAMQAVLDSVGLDDLPDAINLKAFSGRSAIPTLYETLAFLTEGSMEGFLKYAAETYKQPWQYMPLEIWDEYAETADDKRQPEVVVQESGQNIGYNEEVATLSAYRAIHPLRSNWNSPAELAQEDLKLEKKKTERMKEPEATKSTFNVTSWFGNLTPETQKSYKDLFRPSLREYLSSAELVTTNVDVAGKNTQKRPLAALSEKIATILGVPVAVVYSAMAGYKFDVKVSPTESRAQAGELATKFKTTQAYVEFLKETTTLRNQP